jgi:L-tartrate/succinate antiporter
LSPGAWHYFALFAAVIAAQITKPLPGAVTTLMGVCIAALFKFAGKTPAEATKWALSGFSNDTVWLIAAATIFALGYEATGLGRRIALSLVKLLGKRTLGLGYAIAVSDLVLAPFMPSNTARSGGTIYPVVKNIPPLYDSLPDKNPRGIGSYLMWTAFATTNVTSAMFITALAPNLLALELAKKFAKVEVSWTQWMIGFLPVGILLFLVTPLLAHVLYPPQIKLADEVVNWAAKELSSMGRISRREITMASLALIALTAWIAAAKVVTATMVALCVIALMLLTRIVKWADIAAYKQAWTTLVWFATLALWRMR